MIMRTLPDQSDNYKFDALNRAFAAEKEADVDLARMAAAAKAFIADKFKEAL